MIFPARDETRDYFYLAERDAQPGAISTRILQVDDIFYNLVVDWNISTTPSWSNPRVCVLHFTNRQCGCKDSYVRDMS